MEQSHLIITILYKTWYYSSSLFMIYKIRTCYKSRGDIFSISHKQRCILPSYYVYIALLKPGSQYTCCDRHTIHVNGKAGAKLISSKDIISVLKIVQFDLLNTREVHIAQRPAPSPRRKRRKRTRRRK